MNINNLNSLIKVASDLIRWSQTPTGRNTIRVASMVARVVPPVVKQIDSWISSATYADAVVEVKKIESYDINQVAKIYEEFSEKIMSEGSRQALQESLKRRAGGV